MAMKPCTVCGEPSPGSRCPDHRPVEVKRRPKGHVHTNEAGWKRLSARVRRDSPFCEECGATEDLTTDHVIPVSERPDLAREPLNCRVLCRSCNGRRGNRCTDAERRAVLDAILARRRRRAMQSPTGIPRVVQGASGVGQRPLAALVRPGGQAQSASHTAPMFGGGR